MIIKNVSLDIVCGITSTLPDTELPEVAFAGKSNVGKSSLINALTHQDTALVSDIPGTTTDPVFKAMEIHGLGPCVFIDTAGFDDEGELGASDRHSVRWKRPTSP